MKKPLIAPSILSANFSKLAQEVSDLENAGADWLHIDVMDGHFVPNLTMGPDIVKALKKHTKLPIDVHLMVSQPQNFIESFRNAGADWISFHVEATPHSQKILHQIKSCGAKAGIVLCPATPLSSLECLWDDLDYILLMSVNPGFSGQSFIPQSLQKTKDLHLLRKSKNREEVLIQMDGGISPKNANELHQAGVDVMVSGSGIFSSTDYAKTIQALKA